MYDDYYIIKHLLFAVYTIEKEEHINNISKIEPIYDVSTWN